MMGFEKNIFNLIHGAVLGMFCVVFKRVIFNGIILLYQISTMLLIIVLDESVENMNLGSVDSVAAPKYISTYCNSAF